jgi:hypothetical protein
MKLSHKYPLKTEDKGNNKTKRNYVSDKEQMNSSLSLAVNPAQISRE